RSTRAKERRVRAEPSRVGGRGCARRRVLEIDLRRMRLETRANGDCHAVGRRICDVAAHEPLDRIGLLVGYETAAQLGSRSPGDYGLGARALVAAGKTIDA